VIPITAETISQCPSLQLIAISATGTEWLDTAYCAAKGIWVINCPGTNIEAVSEHALAFYFAARKKIAEMDAVMKVRNGGPGEWLENGTLTNRWDMVGGPPLSCGMELVGIMGYGRLGRRIERLCRGVGMREVIVAGRKGVMGSTNGEEKGGIHRVPFKDVLKTVTVLVICCPRDASTIDLIGEEELRSMRKEAIIVNVARGGIVNETALAKALTEGWIAAAATDVLEKEPGGRGTTPLLPLEGDVPNLTITPHIAWYGAQSMVNLKAYLKEAVEAWMRGRPINVVVQGR
jgi:lactate dehydrogenase-like 2-hydroxyacid dehydrogenase